MTVTTPGRTRLCVTLELEPTPAASGDFVLAAAMQCFTASDPVELALSLRGVTDVEESHAADVAARCQAVCPDAGQMPDVVLLFSGEEPEHPVVLSVQQTGQPVPDARAALLLANLARELWDGEASPEPPTQPAPAPPPAAAPARPALTLRDPALGGTGTAAPGAVTDRSQLTALLSRLASAPAEASTAAPAAPVQPPQPVTSAPKVPAPRSQARPGGDRAALRTAALERIAAVDGECRAARLRTGGRIFAAVVVQHLDSWGALHTLTDALREHPDVRLDVVALDSQLSRFPGETAKTLTDAGYEVRDADWMLANRSRLDLVALCDGYDSFRPDGLRVADFAAAGVRLVYSPYGTNIGGEAGQQERQYNGLLHNVAWRVLAPTSGQKDLFGQFCEAGNEHVRCLGSVKRERVLDLLEHDKPGAALRRATGARVNVLWNPHFTVGDDGWSTFLTFVSPMLRYFTTRTDVGLILRPHFRLLPDLRGIPALAGVEKTLRSAAAQHRRIVIDESRDYLAAFAAGDALLSDQSSLIPEYLPLRRPVLHLTRPGGLPLNDDARWVEALPTASTWSQVARFLGAVAARRAQLPPAEVIGAEHLGRLDAGAGGRAANMLVEDLRREVLR